MWQMVSAYVLVKGWIIDLMNIDSFISLERFCSSLPTIWREVKGIPKSPLPYL